MKRGGPLRRDPEKANAWRRRSKRLKPASAKTIAARPEHDKVRAAVFARDGHKCLLLGWTQCHGPLTPHHVLKASAGGAYTADNLITLCRGHNEQVEASPDWAWELGLVVRFADTPEDALARRRRAGILR